MRLFLCCTAVAAIALLSLPLPGRAGDSTLVVIANKAVQSSTLSRDDLRSIFQTRKNTWPDGMPVRAFNLPDANVLRTSFDLAVLGLDPSQAARYWIDRRVRGGDRPPAIVPSSALMVRLVAKTVGSIGYVEPALVNPSVKVLARVVGGQLVKP
jgi:ABC-type phosphate transport system substrate-binding protein